MKKSFIFCALSLISINLFAFGWPVENTESNSINSYFGQNRGDTLSTSLVFSEPTLVKSVEKGELLVLMTEEQDDSDFFPTTLGTSVIISHEDDLISVYGNLDKNTINSELTKHTHIQSQTVLAATGMSGWQNNNSSLEFQIIDTKNDVAINPKILLDRLNNEFELFFSNVTLKNKNDVSFDLRTQRSFPAGVYRIYQKRDKVVSPYKTNVLLNGIISDQISYDTIKEENNKLYVIGKKKYTSSNIYPNKENQLLGEVMLTPGKNTLTIIISDFLGNQKQVNYFLSIY